jgi:glycosyltransferase involved in cell wall biosynthesis
VIVPTVDRPALLREAIDSVLAQTLTDFEIVVVGSGIAEDGGLPADPRIRWVRLPTRSGPAAARNAGVAAARGRSICFLDDDDLYTPDRLALAARGLEGAPVAVCWQRFADRDLGAVTTLHGDVGDSILDGPTPSLGATAVRRDTVVPFDERWQAVEDVEWWLRIAQRSAVTTVPEVGYLVRRHDGERHGNSLQARLRENEQLIEVHRDYLEAHPAALAYRWKRVGLLALSVGDRRRARTAFVQSLRARFELATGWHLARSVVPIGDR